MWTFIIRCRNFDTQLVTVMGFTRDQAAQARARAAFYLGFAGLTITEFIDEEYKES